MAGVVDGVARDAIRRVSRRSAHWWRTETAAGRTRADAVDALVVTLAHCAQAVEGAPTCRTPPPPARDDVRVDQLAVMAYDLTLALRAAPATPPATQEADRALAAIRQTLAEVDPRGRD